MKTLIMVIGLLISANLMANGNRPIKKELESKLRMDLHDYEFSYEQEDFVMVTFSIENQKIIVKDIMGSNLEIINKVSKQLENITMDNFYPSNNTYNFKFIFSKQ